MNVIEEGRVQFRRGRNLCVHYLLKKINAQRSVSPVAESWLDQVLSRYEGEEVFCHVSLSAVNAAFKGNPYDFLRESLHDHFDTIIAPGNTDYFLQSSLFHKKYSKPKQNIGMFSRLLLEDAEYRTDDAMKSLIVDGPYRFDDCDHTTSYGAESCFGKLERDNVLILNIGTPWLKGTQFHHLEYEYGAPYMKEVEMDGVLFRDGKDSPEEISQMCGIYDSTWAFNRWKLRRTLKAQKVLERHERNGFQVMAMRAGDIRKVLGPKLEVDPYYIVT